MSEIVVDASVALKWLVQEEYSADALLLLSSSVISRWSLIAPEVILAEVGHALRRLVNRNELTAPQATALFDAFVAHNPIQLFSLTWRTQQNLTLAQDAMQIGNQYICSFYDSVYIALALGRNGTLVTADRRLFGKPLPLQPNQNLVWIGDLAQWLSR